MVPKSKGGTEIVDSCLACHRAIHACFPLKDLATKYNTVKALMADHRFRQMVRWISKQDPAKRLTVERPKDQQDRGKFR